MTYYTNLPTVDAHVDRAKSYLQPDITFRAKAHKKEALDLLNAAYDKLRVMNTEFSKTLSRHDRFSIPHDLYQIRDKHFRLFGVLFHHELERLVQLRSDFKNLEVIKVGA